VRHIFARPTGDVSRRLHGVMRQLEARAESARRAARAFDQTGQSQFGASLRGKARGYDEARYLLIALDSGRPIKRGHRWLRKAGETA
jgi:hypothetical protein